MKTLTQDQKLAMLVVPVLLFGVLGSNDVFAYDTDLDDEQKDAVIEAHELRQAGDFGGARSILEKANVRDRMLIGKSPEHTGRHEKREAIRHAIETNDYEAYVQATQDTLFESTVTEDMFTTMVRAHELREEGRFGEAEALLDKSGIERPGQMMGGRHGGMGMHRDQGQD